MLSTTLDRLRFPLRTAGFVGLTFSLYGMLEVDTAVSPRKDRDEVLAKWIERYGKGLLKLYGVDVKASGPYVGEGKRYPGRDAQGRGRLFIMNHRSGLDVAITLAHFDATIVSRADLAGWPVIGVAARRVGTLFVDRSSRKSGADVTRAMSDAIGKGHSIMIYPEGTTYGDDVVRPLRPGVFRVAERTGAEIVPVGLAYGGGDAAYVDEPFAAHMRRVSDAKHTRAAIAVGDPIPPARSMDELRALAHERLQALVHRARATLGEVIDQ